MMTSLPDESGGALEPQGAVRLFAPAKLTLSLRVTGVRSDGYHELASEMVSIDLADELVIEADPTKIEIVMEALDPDLVARSSVPMGPNNLIWKALRAVGRGGRVRLTKRIPAAGGLGGGSSDAAAILRWASQRDLGTAMRLGSDVPFCVIGGRAFVEGRGERITPLPFEPRSFILLVPPFLMSTATVYAAWDRLHGRRGNGQVVDREAAAPLNDLTTAALATDARLAQWRDAFARLVGRAPRLAGSGPTWFVEGDLAELGLESRATLEVNGSKGVLLTVRAVPSEWAGPSEQGGSRANGR